MQSYGSLHSYDLQARFNDALPITDLVDIVNCRRYSPDRRGGDKATYGNPMRASKMDAIPHASKSKDPKSVNPETEERTNT